MSLRIVGAGLPRTGTESRHRALPVLLGGQCYHMRTIPGHPFDCGPHWRTALDGGAPDWDHLYTDYVAAVDWPSSLFWPQLRERWPEAIVLLSHRDSARTWLDSMEATILPVARRATRTDWSGGKDLLDMLERFVGTQHWDDAAVLMSAYDTWLARVRDQVPPALLVDWTPGDGWAPLCAGLGTPMPQHNFPWTNRREDWG